MSSGIVTAPPAPHWFLLEPGVDLSCILSSFSHSKQDLFLVVKPHAAEPQERCGHAHLGWAYLLAFSGKKGVSSQDKDLLCFVR